MKRWDVGKRTIAELRWLVTRLKFEGIFARAVEPRYIETGPFKRAAVARAIGFPERAVRYAGPAEG